MVHEAVLLREEVKSLQAANEAATNRRSRKKKRIQKRGTLTMAEGTDIIARRDALEQVEAESRQEAVQSGGSRQGKARCRLCREPGHNARTCKKGATTTVD
jgi:hypothetical protein